MAGLQRKWRRLRSGLYVPPLLRRLHKDERGAWFPGCREGSEDCTACKDGIHPAELTVTFAGITNDECEECLQVNTGWTIPIFGSCFNLGATEDYQAYHERFDVDICEDNQLNIQINIYWNRQEVSGARQIAMTVYSMWNNLDPHTQLMAYFALYETSQSEPFDCENFSSLDIPLYTGYNGACDTTGASALLSA